MQGLNHTNAVVAADGQAAQPYVDKDWLGSQIIGWVQRLEHLSSELVPPSNRRHVNDPAIQPELLEYVGRLNAALNGLVKLLTQQQCLAGVEHHLEVEFIPPEQPPHVPAAGTLFPWAGLPPELLAAILHPTHMHKEARAVCKLFRDAFDTGVQRATLHLLAPAVLSHELLSAPPPCARVLRLDAADMALGCRDIGQTTVTMQSLADALKCWPVTVPLQLKFTGNNGPLVPSSMALQWGAVMEALRCPTCAPGGLQALDFSGSLLEPRGAQQLAAAMQASQQMSALQELGLGGCGIEDEGAIALFNALHAATHVRSLSLLDVSWCGIGPPGAAALAACLCGAPHLTASLRQLVMCNNGMQSEGMATLARAVASCGVQLTHLDISDNALVNDVDQEGAKAWAAALRASTHLASLQVLDLSGNGVDDDGMPTLCESLQAATHLARLQRLALLPTSCGAEGVTRFAHLLLATPHLAGIQSLSLRCADAWEHPAAAAAVASAVLAAGSPLTQLRSLDLGGCSGAGLQCLCDTLPGATHLTGLQELSLESWPVNTAVHAALAASPHLSGLRQLTLGQKFLRFAILPQELLGVLQAAPHLRNLTNAKFDCRADSARGALRNVLQLLPHVRSLSLLLGDSAKAVWDALQDAPCVPILEELCIRWAYMDPSSHVAHIVAALQVCACLPGLRRLQLHNVYDWSGGLEGLAQALAAAPHLSSLRELQLDASNAPTQLVYEALATSKLAGVRVVFNLF